MTQPTHIIKLQVFQAIHEATKRDKIFWKKAVTCDYMADWKGWRFFIANADTLAETRISAHKEAGDTMMVVNINGDDFNFCAWQLRNLVAEIRRQQKDLQDKTYQAMLLSQDVVPDEV